MYDIVNPANIFPVAPELQWLDAPDEVSSRTYEVVNGVIQLKPVPLPATVDQLSATARTTRDALLAKTDWTQMPDVPQLTKDKWAPYRQALRDVPAQVGFPADIIWPVAPV